MGQDDCRLATAIQSMSHESSNNRYLRTVVIDSDTAQGQRLGNVRVGVRPEDVEVSTETRKDGVGGIIAGKVSLPMMNGPANPIILSSHVATSVARKKESL